MQCVALRNYIHDLSKHRVLQSIEVHIVISWQSVACLFEIDGSCGGTQKPAPRVSHCYIATTLLSHHWATRSLRVYPSFELSHLNPAVDQSSVTRTPCLDRCSSRTSFSNSNRSPHPGFQSQPTASFGGDGAPGSEPYTQSNNR